MLDKTPTLTLNPNAQHKPQAQKLNPNLNREH